MLVKSGVNMLQRYGTVQYRKIDEWGGAYFIIHATTGKEIGFNTGRGLCHMTPAERRYFETGGPYYVFYAAEHLYRPMMTHHPNLTSALRKGMSVVREWIVPMGQFGTFRVHGETRYGPRLKVKYYLWVGGPSGMTSMPGWHGAAADLSPDFKALLLYAIETNCQPDALMDYVAEHYQDKLGEIAERMALESGKRETVGEGV